MKHFLWRLCIIVNANGSIKMALKVYLRAIAIADGLF